MADPWPAGLYKCFVLGFQDSLADGRGSYKPDVGPAIVRRRTTAAVRKVSGSMQMTRDQWAILKTFVDDTLLGGSLPFTFQDPMTGDLVLARFPDDVLPSVAQLTPTSFRVAIDLEILP